MNQLITLIVVSVVWGVLELFTEHICGIKLTGWRRWTYSLPAYGAGLVIGHFLIR